MSAESCPTAGSSISMLTHLKVTKGLKDKTACSEYCITGRKLATHLCNELAYPTGVLTVCWTTNAEVQCCSAEEREAALTTAAYVNTLDILTSSSRRTTSVFPQRAA